MGGMYFDQKDESKQVGDKSRHSPRDGSFRFLLRSLASLPSDFGGLTIGGGYLFLSEVECGKEVICSHGGVRCEV